MKPQSSLKALMVKVKEKFALNLVNSIVYEDEDDGEEVRIQNDTDYVNLFDYVEKKKLTCINLIIQSEEGKSRKKKLKDLISNMKPPVHGENSSINNEIELDKDLRNLRSLLEEGRWTNQSYNQTEQRRIYYIKEKKEFQRSEQRKEKEQIEKMEDMFLNENIKKRLLKNPKIKAK